MHNEKLVADMLAEAKDAEAMARDYLYNLELHTAYAAEGRTWRQAARMVEHYES